MINDPLVSIYITNYNYGKYIDQSIISALKQSYKKLEIIIVDDFSNDDSIVKINKYRKNKNVKVIFNRKRLGLINSAIKAISISKGKYFLRLDADDILKKNAIKMLVNITKKNSKISMVFPNFRYYFEKTKSYKSFKYQKKRTYDLLDFPAHGACSLIKKKSFNRVGGYSKLFDRQDGFYIWSLFILNQFKIVNLSKSLFFYRIHGENLSKNSNRILGERKKIIDYLLRRFKDKKKKLLILKEKTEYELKNLNNVK